MEATLYKQTESFKNTNTFGDRKVVDMARVSFNKTHDNYTTEQNNRLISFLATHNHFTPFCHTHVTFNYVGGIKLLSDILIDKELMAGIFINRPSKMF